MTPNFERLSTQKKREAILLKKLIVYSHQLHAFDTKSKDEGDECEENYVTFFLIHKESAEKKAMTARKVQQWRGQRT